MSGRPPTSTYMANIHRIVSPAPEPIRTGDHLQNKSFTLVCSVKKGEGFPPPAKCGGGSGGQPPKHPENTQLLRVYAGFVAM